MRLFITGTPRSGTRWIANALRSVGVRVGHEEVKKDGMVSSIHAVDDFLYINRVSPNTSAMTFENVWMQTRDPRDAIPSIATALRVSFWHWQEKHTGVPGDLEPALLRAMLYWAEWVPLAQRRHPTWTYKLEDMATVWPEMMERLGLPVSATPQREVGRYTSGAARLSWDEMVAIDGCAADAVRKVALPLGYA